jgi:type II secretory pathway pseudopilin PulG
MNRLAEVLIAGAIVGVIGLISGFAVLSARSHTRDVTRLANVNEIRMALEMYFQNHSAYPIAATPVALGQALTACLSQEGFSGPCASSGPTPYLVTVATPPTAGLRDKVPCSSVDDVYCYSGSADQFRIEFELESANALLGVAEGVNCLSETGFSAGACAAL